MDGEVRRSAFLASAQPPLGLRQHFDKAEESLLVEQNMSTQN
jgi:hypothetical protein